MTVRSRKPVLAGAALALLLGAAACGDDDSSSTTTAPSGSTALTTSSSATATTPPPASTVPVTASSAPATAAPTTSTSSTSTTIAATTTSSTLPPRGLALVLRDNSIGDAVFGADPDEVIAYMRSILGPPTADTGWADPFASFGVCPGTEVRGVTWGDLTLLFSDSSTVTSARRHFFSYSFGPPFGPTIDPAGPRTANGISVGSTVAELRAAYPDVIVNPADDIFEANFYINDNLTGFLSGAGDEDVVTSIHGGIGCGE